MLSRRSLISINFNLFYLQKRKTKECKTKECDPLRVLMGTRNEFENNIPDATYPADFPEIENDRFSKCILSLTLQTGPLAQQYRTILSGKNITIYEYCAKGDLHVYSPHSKYIHTEDIGLPDHCYTMEVYEDIIKHHPKLFDFFNKGYRRYDLIEAILEMRQARLKKKSSYGLGM